MQCCDMTKRSKKAWTKWRRLVSEHARSGQSVKVFCREHGLCRPYFFVWKKRLEEDTPTKSLEVQGTGRVPSTPGDSSVEIRLRSGRRPLVRRAFDAGHAAALPAVGQAAACPGCQVCRRCLVRTQR